MKKALKKRKTEKEKKNDGLIAENDRDLALERILGMLMEIHEKDGGFDDIIPNIREFTRNDIFGPALAVYEKDGSYGLEYRPALLEDRTPNELAAMLMHEMLHVRLGHHRTEYINKVINYKENEPVLQRLFIYNCAADMVVNQQIPKEILPADAMTVELMGYEPGLTLEEYYNKLIEENNATVEEIREAGMSLAEARASGKYREALLDFMREVGNRKPLTAEEVRRMIDNGEIVLPDGEEGERLRKSVYGDRKKDGGIGAEGEAYDGM